MGADLIGFGVTPTRGDHVRLAGLPEGRQIAFHFPTFGWSAFEQPCSTPRGRPLPDEALRAAHLFEADPTTKFTREWDSDIASRDPAVAVANNVEQKEWWVMGGDGSICTRLAGLDFAERRLQNRPVRRHPNPLGQWGIRLGPNACGAIARNH